jgi:hypothetical protein
MVRAWRPDRSMSDIYRQWQNENQAAARRQLYRSDPVWRLTKLKANWERRERMRRGVAA